MASWEKYGLVSRGWFQSSAEAPNFSQLSRPERFRLALEDGGGLFPAFAWFLNGRSDLLPSPYLDELRKTRPLRKLSSSPTLDPQWSGRLSAFEWIRATPGCEIFAALGPAGPVVVETFRNHPDSSAAWKSFRSQIGLLRGTPEAAVCKPAVLDEFSAWLQAHSDIERKRAMLGNLNRSSGQFVTRFPQLLPDLQSPLCLVYEKMEGTSIEAEVRPGVSTAANSLRILAEAILEQSLLLSLVDTEARLENYLLLPEGHIGFRTLPAWVSVPVEWHYQLLQYVASSAAANAPRALQMLCRMSSSRDSYAAEQQLLDRLSALQPELKINVVTPESVTALENYWRALAATSLVPPLFLQLFHRNMALLGQYNGAVAPSTDVVAEALWPVLGRILRFHFGQVLTTEKSREWISSSALVFLTAARQVSLAMERLRENSSDLLAEPGITDSVSHDAKLNRRAAALVASAVALVLFLFFVRLGMSAAGSSWPLLANAGAIFSAGALCSLVAGIK